MIALGRCVDEVQHKTRSWSFGRRARSEALLVSKSTIADEMDTAFSSRIILECLAHWVGDGVVVVGTETGCMRRNFEACTVRKK